MRADNKDAASKAHRAGLNAWRARQSRGVARAPRNDPAAAKEPAIPAAGIQRRIIPTELGKTGAVSMPNPDILALEQSNLNEFLFADVGIEPNGMRLTVLSALARSDLDPWREAGRLNGLSRAGAIEALAGLIEALPGGVRLRSDAVSIATRLVCLLPQRSGALASASRLSMTRPGGKAVAGRGRAVQIRTETMLSNPQWFALLAVLAALIAGLGAGALYRAADRPTASGPTWQAKPAVADGPPPSAAPSPTRLRPPRERPAAHDARVGL